MIDPHNAIAYMYFVGFSECLKVKTAKTVLLADDHGIIRDGLRTLFGMYNDFNVIGEATNGREAVTYALQLKPDIVIMDISMPVLNGIEATRQICNALQETHVVALSVHTDFRYVLQMFQAGAQGYVQKNDGFAEVVAAIEATMQRKHYVSQSIAGTILDQLLQHSDTSNMDESAALLTAREREVLQLLAEGHTAKEISHILRLKPYTVESYRRNLMDKLNLHGIAQLTRYAIREGITVLEEA